MLTIDAVTISAAFAKCAIAPNLRQAMDIFHRRHNHRPPRGSAAMNLQVTLAPLIALIAGILILVRPRLLNYIVAIYLIVIGLLGLFAAAGVNIR